MAFDQGWAQKVQDHIHGVAALTMPSGLKVLLMTASGDSTTDGTELASGGDYVAGTGQSIAFSAATAATPAVSANSAAVAFTNMPAATIAGLEIWNATGRQELGDLDAAKTTAAGDTLSFAASAISSALQ